MAIAIFTWCPRLSANASTKFSVRQAQMGDGYVQVSGNGLNPRSQEWSLEFTGNETYIAAIKTFLDAHKGYQAFQWQPPLEPVGLYRCDEYSPTALGNDMHNLTVTFKTAYGLSPNSEAQLPPVITLQPLDLNVVEGSGATFSVAAAGTQPFTYKWEKSINGTSWSQVSTDAQFTITQTTLADSSMVRVTVTNNYGNALSNAVSLNVQEQPVVPVITVQPAPTSQALTGGNIVLTAEATGSGTLAWTWQKQYGSSWMNVEGADTNTLTLAAVEADASGLYRVIVANNVGQVISDNSQVTVDEHILDLTQTALPTGLTYSGPAKFYRSVSNMLSAAAADVCPLEFEGNTVAGRSLPQPAITNLVTAPFAMLPPDWSVTRAAATAGQASPDGNNNAVLLAASAVNGTHYLEQAIAKDNSTDYTLSVLVKAAGVNYAMIQFANVSYQSNPQSVYIDLTDGSVVASELSRVSVMHYGNGWYRVSSTITTNTSGANILAQVYASVGTASGSESFTGDGTGGILVWGAMVQKSPLPLRALPIGASSAAESITVDKNYGATRYELSFSNGTKEIRNFGSGATVSLPIETQNWHQRFISRIRYMA